MCDYHYQKLCFHPEKVDSGQVAVKCDVHDCTHCTNTVWQKNNIRREIDYFSSLLTIAKQSLSELDAQGPSALDDGSPKAPSFHDPRNHPLSRTTPSSFLR